MEPTNQPLEGFAETGLSAGILTALKRAGIVTPTPIQTQAIPVALRPQDLIGIAQTGTGKTLAFSLPILEQLSSRRLKKALIIVPTRELALQVEENIKKVSQYLPFPVRTLSLIGGMPIYRQIKDLRYNPAILVATPGRLRDHMEQKTVSLADVGVLVLDEADRMLDMGFAPQINFICAALPTDRQTMLFSATMAPEIARLTSAYLKDPVRVEVARSDTNKLKIQQELCYVRAGEKVELLGELLGEHRGTVLVFSRTKHGASKLAEKVRTMGHTAAEIHSNRSLSQRRQALDGFKRGTYRVLVATDVASRGIDVPDIALVINYDLPDAAEDYVHRIGRTGRAGQAGKAISLVTPDQHRDVRTIERLMNQELPLSPRSQAQPVAVSSGQPSRFRSPASRTGGYRGTTYRTR